jgi:hypothetical protein
MTSALLPLWILSRLLRQPACWLLLLAFGAVGPLLGRLSPFDPAPLELVSDWSLPAAILGCGLALLALASAADFLRRVPPGRRLLAEVAGLLALGFLFQASLFCGAVLSSGWSSGVLDTIPTLLRTDLYLASLAAVVLRLGLPPPLGLSLLALVTWVMPSFASEAPDGLSALLVVLEASPEASPASFLLSLLPIGALLGLAWILRIPLQSTLPPDRC